jgi:hypothetical protein
VVPDAGGSPTTRSLRNLPSLGILREEGKIEKYVLALKPSFTAWRQKLLLRILEVPGSHLGPDTGYPY